MQTNSLSSTNATKIYINLEILEVVEIIDKSIFLKFIITKSLINNIYYLTKCHLLNIFLKNSMIGMVKNMILYKKYQKYMQKKFHRRIYL